MAAYFAGADDVRAKLTSAVRSAESYLNEGLGGTRLKHCNQSTIPKKGTQNQALKKEGENRSYA